MTDVPGLDDLLVRLVSIYLDVLVPRSVQALPHGGRRIRRLLCQS